MKPIVYLFIIIVVILLSGAGGYYLGTKQSAKSVEPTIFPTITSPVAPTMSRGKSGKICTMDAKRCPDGSYVGRTGPNCEFAPCPR